VAGSVDAAGARDKARAEPSGDRLTIFLEPRRERHVSWAVFGVVVGALLIWRLGTVAQWLGGFLILLGLWATWKLVATYLYEAGAIVVDGSRVELPRGLCKPGKPDVVERSQVAHAYLLRRAVPWNASSPVLVVEVGDRAYPYPRDWFATEADQRRVIHALAKTR